MENLARKFEESSVYEGDNFKKKELPIIEAMKILVSKLREYEKIISDILGKKEKEAGNLADKVEKYANELKSKGYIPGSSFEHVINTLTAELCPCAKRFNFGKGNKKDKDIIIESFAAMNDYIDLLLKYKLFEKKELKENDASSEENCKLSAAQYVAKYKKILEEKNKYSS
jgi:hypothetical protein